MARTDNRKGKKLDPNVGEGLASLPRDCKIFGAFLPVGACEAPQAH